MTSDLISQGPVGCGYIQVQSLGTSPGMFYLSASCYVILKKSQKKKKNILLIRQQPALQYEDWCKHEAWKRPMTSDNRPT